LADVIFLVADGDMLAHMDLLLHFTPQKKTAGLNLDILTTTGILMQTGRQKCWSMVSAMHELGKQPISAR
jgi:hypothetical protein